MRRARNDRIGLRLCIWLLCPALASAQAAAIDDIAALLANDDSPQARYQAAEMLRSLSASRFARLRAAAPDSPEVFELLGLHHSAFGRHREALEQFHQALARDPDRRGLRFLIGDAHWKLREYEAALPFLLEEIQANPGHAMARHRLGNIYLMRDEPVRALPHLEAAVRDRGDFLEARRDLGKALNELGRHDRALEQLCYVAERLPQDDRVHAQLASVYRSMGDREKAAAEMRIHAAILRERFKAAQRR